MSIFTQLLHPLTVYKYGRHDSSSKVKPKHLDCPKMVVLIMLTFVQMLVFRINLSSYLTIYICDVMIDKLLCNLLPGRLYCTDSKRRHARARWQLPEEEIFWLRFRIAAGREDASSIFIHRRRLHPSMCATRLSSQDPKSLQTSKMST